MVFGPRSAEISAAAADRQCADHSCFWGGSVDIFPNDTKATGDDSVSETGLGLLMHWNTQDSSGDSVRFPWCCERDIPLDNFMKAYQPASFNLDGKDVLDETYRKAGKPDRF